MVLIKWCLKYYKQMVVPTFNQTSQSNELGRWNPLELSCQPPPFYNKENSEVSRPTLVLEEEPGRSRSSRLPGE